MSNDIIQAMRMRASQNQLSGQGPTKEQWLDVLDAASRAADHAGIKPWRFRIFEGDSRDKLGECYWQCAKSEVSELPESKRESFIKKAQRAPAVLMAYASIDTHPKVPTIEQIMAVAASCQQVLLGLESLGYGAIWRTGPVAHSDITKSLLGLQSNDQIVGFIYVGQSTEVKPYVEDTGIQSRVTWA
ncbi:nitroreductase [Marinomonas sp. 2405UD68-3]|uniref:nitroreductase family protein n=1 Tax=Marinomonas sp. 2405UD68-3 TaxID=3391835 RepID=UPI0039C9E399